jgi:hypothetical protein
LVDLYSEATVLVHDLTKLANLSSLPFLIDFY